MPTFEKDETIIKKRSRVSNKQTSREQQNEHPPTVRRMLWWIGGITAILIALASLFDSGQKAMASATTFLASISGYFRSGSLSCTWDMKWEEKAKCDRRR